MVGPDGVGSGTGGTRTVGEVELVVGWDWCLPPGGDALAGQVGERSGWHVMSRGWWAEPDGRGGLGEADAPGRVGPSGREAVLRLGDAAPVLVRAGAVGTGPDPPWSGWLGSVRQYLERVSHNSG